jgi:hypothetical protein
MGLFLCYDIRGIQSFIFKIPKLKYIIGGSALIDRFDRETVKDELSEPGCNFLFSGGGKGAFFCESDTCAALLQAKLVAKANIIGLDISFGKNEDFATASRKTTEYFPFIPKMIEDGEPCPISGLYPVLKEDALKKTAHLTVRQRIVSKGDDGYEKMFRWFEKSLLSDNSIMHVAFDTSNAKFFHNVDATDEFGQPDKKGVAGAQALGNRNRWAVICMDGNDIGSQLRHMTDVKKLQGKEMTEWVIKMSSALDFCTQKAVSEGIQRVVTEWAGSKDFIPPDDDGVVTLPIRPLIVGGDDITVICHVSYAMTFVKEAIRVFNETSISEQAKAEKEKTGQSLWPATKGKLTISAGVLYCPVSLPLHTAIGYTESLLALAKGRGRKDAVKDEPSPECIDWEQITDSIVDTPSARRQREFIFNDKDRAPERSVILTSRPCTLEEYTEIENLAKRYDGEFNKNDKVPNSIRHKILPSMRKGFSDRLAFIAEIAKHQELLASHLSEKEFEIGKEKTHWKYNGAISQKTDVIDALLLLEEISRMKEETV